MLEQLKEQIKAMIADDEYMALQAELTMKTKDALVAVGFTREEAITLIAKK